MTASLAIIILGGFGACLLVLAGVLLFSRKQTAEQRERARRLYLSARGRLSEAEITDVYGSLIGYTYEVAGVVYHSSQETASFQQSLPRDPLLLLGPASVKYSPANPASSIVISEQWSGIRTARTANPRQKGA